MNEKRQDFGACSGDENIIYACGGSSNSDENTLMSSLEKIDFKTKNWI